MPDLQQLESELLKAVAAAGDEAAIEAVRVAALGKKGSVSELLKTLGTMTPEERKQQGPLINGLRDKVSAAINAKKDTLKAARQRARARPHSSGEPGDRRSDGDLRRYGFFGRRRPGY
jgi:phenylalanyl-tRNA synthetase alpha chain